MEEARERQDLQKTKVFNLIILDRSDSMGCIRSAAVDGFNETLAGIRKAQEKYEATQEHYVSLVTFCSCETRHVFDKVPAGKAHPLEMGDYVPCCCTPLYDAMGFTPERPVQGREGAGRYRGGGYHHYRRHRNASAATS